MNDSSPDAGPADGGPRRSPGTLLARVSVMMFLQYWSLGLWYVTVTTFIAANTEGEGEGLFSAGFVGYSAGAAAIGSLVAPTFFGWVADRLFSAKKVLSLLHAGAGLALWWMHESASQTAFFLAMATYFQMLAPTVTLTNTIALGKLSDRDREFPVVRLYGTVAWIAAGVFVGVVCRWWFGDSIEPTRLPIRMAVWSHAAMAAYALTLPKSQPRRQPKPGPTTRGSGGRRSPGLLSNRPFVLFLVVSVVAAVTSQPYNLANVFLNQSGYVGAAATLTLGQMTEVACLAAMPLLHRRLRLKTLFLVGVLAWTLRYVLLAAASFGDPTSLASLFVYAAILVHGPAYVFVYLTGQLYVDRLVDPSNRGVAQGLHTMATGGVGHLCGAGMTGWAQAAFLTPAGVSPPPYDWAPFWLTPVGLGLLLALLFAILFAEGPKAPSQATDAPATAA